MKEYDYAHQMNRPVPLTKDGQPTGALLLHRAIKKADSNGKKAPKR
ncbi:hypothetical protein [Stenotrophomonas phage c9-N]|uniref:Uncharacterized protein n=1 Tax=Stenotrophomonas phage vB_SmeS_BUCT700 TaxID=2924895 RepID=A0AAE9G9E6_9CAUD|nr:hypothetical protein [Stenotrophomonas phage vB_SmeS_BUCT700]UNY50305.1 hypothetical protein [Stenotrophomonas phage vB_SmeS_BUCT703]WKC56450.1 hypothetical protein [Stenotrophomonas phage c9-N]